MSDQEKRIDYWTSQGLKVLGSIVLSLVGILQVNSYTQLDSLTKKLDTYIEEQRVLEGKVNSHDYRLNRNEGVLYDLGKKHQKD